MSTQGTQKTPTYLQANLRIFIDPTRVAGGSVIQDLVAQSADESDAGLLARAGVVLEVLRWRLDSAGRRRARILIQLATDRADRLPIEDSVTQPEGESDADLLARAGVVLEVLRTKSGLTEARRG